MSDDELTAYHEAGHAFLAVYLGASLRVVTIEPDRDDGPARFGDTQIVWDRRELSDREYCERAVLVILAGPVAEMIYRGEPYHPGFVAEWAEDWSTAWDLAAQLVPDEPKRLALLEQTTAKLHALLREDCHWAGLAAVVDNLLAHGLLEGEEVAEILSAWLGDQ